MTHLKELQKKWMKNPKFRAEYEALHLEFEIMNALIRARLRSGLTQAQIAERMGTTQSAVARLEGGRSNPSIRTLERYAEATGTRIRIWFEPVDAHLTARQKEVETRDDKESDVHSVSPRAEVSLPIAT